MRLPQPKRRRLLCFGRRPARRDPGRRRQIADRPDGPAGNDAAAGGKAEHGARVRRDSGRLLLRTTNTGRAAGLVGASGGVPAAPWASLRAGGVKTVTSPALVPGTGSGEDGT